MPTGIYKRTEKQLQQCRNNCRKFGINTRFKKGLIPWNKGMSSKELKNLIRVCKNCSKEYSDSQIKKY